MSLFKWIQVPTGETEPIKAYEKWIVRWEAWTGSYPDSIERAEVFTNEEDANKFKKALEDAAKLLQQYSSRIRIVKQ